MAKPKPQYYLDTRILSIFFLVAMPFVAFGAYVVLGLANSSMRQEVGESLEQRATESRLRVERYVGDQVVELRLMTRWPELAQALGKAPALKPEEAERLARLWGEADTELLQSITGTPLSARLRDVIAVRPGIKVLQVVDARGLLVASSGRSGRLRNHDAPWFTGTTQEPVVERPWVSDVFKPAGSSQPMLEVAWPVLNAEGVLQGAIRMLIDAQDLYGVLAPVRVGRTGHAELVRAKDGIVLASDQAPRVLEARMPGFDMLETAMASRRGHWTVPERRRKATKQTAAVDEPARIVAVSRVEQVPGVEWLVVVEQDLDEALATLDRVRKYLWIHFAGAFGTVILLGLYYSFKLEQPELESEVGIVDELEHPTPAAPEGEKAGQ